MYFFRNLHILLCIFVYMSDIVSCWDTDELELYDLVEEIDRNFYDVLEIEEGATTAEVRKAYRKLSMKLHPDKNKAENAEEQFRQMAAVYEVLKNPTNRARYNEILVNGLPDWRQPVFYYRRARKVGLLELAIIMTFILTVGHGIVMWAVYAEKRFETEEVLNSTRKKVCKTKGKRKDGGKSAAQKEDELDDLIEEELSMIARPRWADLLPARLVMCVISAVTSIPDQISGIKLWWEERKRMKEEEEMEEEEEEEEEPVVRVRQRKPKAEVDQRKPAMATSDGPVVNYNLKPSQMEASSDGPEIPDRRGKPWTDEDLSLLAKAVARFPSGVGSRWEKVGEFIGRTANEAVSKSKSMKQGYATHVNTAAQGVTGAITENVGYNKGKASKSNVGDDISTMNDLDRAYTKQSEEKTTTQNNDSTDGWSQKDQKVLEWAIKQYPKGTAERWEKVAEHIADKTKEDCIARFKYLAELVKRRKEESQKKS